MKRARRGKWLTRLRLARGHAALFAYAYCDRSDSFFTSTILLSSPRFFFSFPYVLFFFFFFISRRARTRSRPPDNQFSNAREKYHRSTNGAAHNSRSMCISRPGICLLW